MVEGEKLLEKKLGDLLKAEGGWSIKLLAVHISGIPDRLCLVPMGKIFFAEIKTTKKNPSKIQLVIHKRLRKMGFYVEVLDTSEQIKQTIRYHVERG